MLIGCLLAKQFVLNTAISKGMGTPVSPLPGILFSALALSAPIQSAFLLSLLPYSWLRRVAIACAWMIVVLLAFAVGNQVHPLQDPPAMFRNTTLCILPLFALGWFIPLGLLNLLRGWQLTPRYVSAISTNRKVSITGLFALTFVVSLCLFALQFGPQGSYLSGLIGMLIGSVLGAIFSLPIYIIMKLPPVFSLACYTIIGAATYFVARLILLAVGSGAMANGSALFLSTLVFATLSGFAIASCFGVDLVTRIPE